MTEFEDYEKLIIREKKILTELQEFQYFKKIHIIYRFYRAQVRIKKK